MKLKEQGWKGNRIKNIGIEDSKRNLIVDKTGTENFGELYYRALRLT